MTRWWSIPILAVWACAPKTAITETSGDTHSSSQDTAENDTDENDTDGKPQDTADSDPVTLVDCAALKDVQPTLTVLSARGGRGLAFDDTGEVVGVSEPHLFRSTYGGEAELWVPSLGELDQIETMANGDFALAHFGNGSVLRVTSTGETHPMATDLYAYGLRLGPDGLVYTANGDAIHRIDPVNNTQELWLDPSDFKPRVLDFSPDASRLYVGTNESEGTVWSIELDENLNPTGTPMLLAEGLGDWHDGLGVDVCGNLYLIDYATLSVYRISADGSTIFTLLAATNSDGMYAHGLAWGSGIGGWREDALYLPQPMNGDTIAEAVIGVPYRTWTGPVKNGP